jgi:hypothetical protein
MASAQPAPAAAAGASQLAAQIEDGRDSYNKQSFGPALNAHIKQVRCLTDFSFLSSMSYFTFSHVSL